MDTIVTARLRSEQPADEIDSALQRALAWFGFVERVCSRFDPDSEVYRLARSADQPTPVSPLLFEAINFSLQVAEASHGAFDPAIGARQAQRGFDRNYVTKRHIPAPTCDPSATYKDVVLDAAERTVRLCKPLLLDLGAVAKGMALDLAATELSQFDSFSIDAGGDVIVKGKNEEGDPWRIGIEHPRQPGLIATMVIGQGAVCTSGDYVRRAHNAAEHHLLDPRTGASPRDVISCSVVAPTAMAADALSTAAFVSGTEAGLRLLEVQAVDGMLVRGDLSVAMTSGFRRLLS
jgi:thiamine biosynthesis lipoprotein